MSRKNKDLTCPFCSKEIKTVAGTFILYAPGSSFKAKDKIKRVHEDCFQKECKTMACTPVVSDVRQIKFCNFCKKEDDYYIDGFGMIKLNGYFMYRFGDRGFYNKAPGWTCFCVDCFRSAAGKDFL